ncbi:MAG: alpha/beta hydrolase [Megasphaera sp.]|jgi:acetyl esterase/lipase|uniref:alpha/beta hydrolase n=1 Tax=Megasphaera sueciensis TaxID=349094 RepID=UPI003CFD50B8|nr:alpha/beta hydrolase [Megasphaera sp.]MCI1824258.1 alpha/beta hydrolase [Megasphaera sp.]
MEHYQLKPELEAFIKRNVQEAAATHFVMTPASMREASLRLAFSQELPKVKMAAVTDAVLSQCGEYDVPVRIYRPTAGTVPLPVLIYYHGGGFVIDSIMVYDPILRRIAKATNHIVVAPEYRLAPENPYPAAEVDALATAKRTLAKLDELHIPYLPDITLAGDSAGGYLAAVVSSHLQEDSRIPITHQILIYPSLDMTHSLPSFEENGIDTYGSNKNKMKWYFDCYLHHVPNRKAISPLFGKLSPHMPSTLMITVQFCPFRDEGAAYTARLKQYGVRTELYNVTNMVHSYLNFEKICYDEICATYKKIAQFLT